MEELIKLHKEYQQIYRPYQALTKIKLNKSDGFEKFDRALGELPSDDVFCKRMNEWRNKITSLIASEKNRRQESFGKLFNDFVRGLRSSRSIPVREFSTTKWRIGQFEINLRPVQSQVTFSYDNELIKNWTTVLSVDDMNQLYSSMENKLKECEINWQIFCDALWDAYECLKKKQEIDGISNYQSVPIKEIIKETMVVLYRYSLDKKIARLKDESKWIFQYNLDLYFTRSKDIPSGKRVSRESGSQDEIRKGKGLMLNGLNADDDYKIFCYLRA